MIEGIDVSAYQPDVDYELVKKSGRQFVIAKATEGFTVSSEYHDHISNARANGLVVGSYHFARPGSRFTAQQQAHLYLAYALVQPGDIRPVLDIERSGNLKPDRLIDWCIEFARTIQQETTRMPIIYTTPYFWQTYLNDTTDLHDLGCGLWVAQWGVDTPDLFGGWTRWRIWQYTDSGDVPGVEGECDLDCVNDWDYIIYEPKT